MKATLKLFLAAVTLPALTSAFVVTQKTQSPKPAATSGVHFGRVATPFLSSHAHKRATVMYAEGDDDDSSSNAMKIIIAGAPASGKGTQCEIIKEKFGVVHLSTGDMLRAAVAAKTEVGKKAKDFMDNGMLVPDEVIIGVVRPYLLLHIARAHRRLVGFCCFGSQ